MIKLSKGAKTALIILGVVVLSAAAIPFAIWVTHTQTAQHENARRRCEEATLKSRTHHVVIEGGKVSPEHTAARLCDRLIITNLDGNERLIAFGQHDKHVSYNGVSEKFLRQNQSFEVELIFPGNYLFHDHEDESVGGTFGVKDLTSKELRP